MTESTQENLFQAMDRFCRLSQALPETQMSLIRFRRMKSYQVMVGKEPVVISRLRKSVDGQVVIRATWEELTKWHNQIGAAIHRREFDGSDS